MEITVKPGNDLSDEEVEEYLAFLAEGGAIHYFKTAREGLKTAFCVAILREGNDLLGIGAIKESRPKYNEKIAERSGWPLSPHKREIGYIVVEKENRGQGFSTEIVKRLLRFDGRVFATTSNPAMISTFKNLGFQREGHEWESKEGATLSLWIKWK